MSRCVHKSWDPMVPASAPTAGWPPPAVRSRALTGDVPGAAHDPRRRGLRRDGRGRAARCRGPGCPCGAVRTTGAQPHARARRWGSRTGYGLRSRRRLPVTLRYRTSALPGRRIRRYQRVHAPLFAAAACPRVPHLASSAHHIPGPGRRAQVGPFLWARRRAITGATRCQGDCYPQTTDHPTRPRGRRLALRPQLPTLRRVNRSKHQASAHARRHVGGSGRSAFRFHSRIPACRRLSAAAPGQPGSRCGA